MKPGQKIRDGEKSYFHQGMTKTSKANWLDCFSKDKHFSAKNVARKRKKRK